jgi:NADPH2:quinone reductase
MKAAWYATNGEAREVLQVGELPTPNPGPGEVRVRLKTSGVNPSDVKSRRARPVTDSLIVPHSDGAGLIDAVGAGVPASRMNERVWLWNAQWLRPMGTASEWIVVPAAQAVHLPDTTDFAAGACLGIPALTALQAVHLAGDLQGKNVLVTGAGSAVGHYIVQLAKMRGARVFGTAGAADKQAHALSAGVDVLLNYKTDTVAERIKADTQGQGVDVIIDMDLSTTTQYVAAGALKAHGVWVCYGSNALEVPLAFRTCLYASIDLRFFLVYDLKPADRARCQQELQDLLLGQKLQHSIGPRFALSDIVKAHEAVEGGRVVGNVVIDL